MNPIATVSRVPSIGATTLALAAIFWPSSGFGQTQPGMSIIDQVRAQQQSVVPKTKAGAPMPASQLAAKIKRLPNILPPEQFDHPYTGLVIVHRLKTEGVMREICADIDANVWLGCSYKLKHACLIVLAAEPVMRAYGITGNMVFRHEEGHCNGWPASHSGARTYWDAKMMPASDTPELIDAESFTIDPVNRSYMWPP